MVTTQHKATQKYSRRPKSQRGEVFAALRKSPLVGEDLTFEREQTDGRPIEL